MRSEKRQMNEWKEASYNILNERGKIVTTIITNTFIHSINIIIIMLLLWKWSRFYHIHTLNLNVLCLWIGDVKLLKLICIIIFARVPRTYDAVADDDFHSTSLFFPVLFLSIRCTIFLSLLPSSTSAYWCSSIDSEGKRKRSFTIVAT